MIQNHQLIKDYLVDLYERCLKVSLRHMVTSCANIGKFVQLHAGVHSGGLFAKLLALDVTGLCAHLTAFVTDRAKRKEIVSLRGPAAQALLDLLQAVCSQNTHMCMPLMHVMAAIGLCYRFSAPASICGRALETVTSIQALPREHYSQGNRNFGMPSGSGWFRRCL